MPQRPFADGTAVLPLAAGLAAMVAGGAIVEQVVHPAAGRSVVGAVAVSALAVAALVALVAWRPAALVRSRRLLLTEDALRAALHASPDPVLVYEAASLRLVAVNGPAVERYGWSEEELLERTVLDIAPPEERERLHHAGPRVSVVRTGRWRHQRRDGELLWGDATTVPVAYRGRRHLMSVVRDVTAQLEAEEQLRRSEARLRAVVERAADAIMTLDCQGTVEAVNPAGEALFGWGEGELAGRHVGEVLLAPAGVGGSWPVAGFDGDVTGRRRDGTEVPVEVSIVEIGEADPPVLSVVARDVTVRRAHEARLSHEATHDPLTGLPGRTLLFDRLVQALARRQRGGRALAVLFCDLDRFKVVNDSLGHGAGDRLLQVVAGRLAGAVRPGDTVARFGGDEFVVLCEGLDEPAAVVAIAERLAGALHEPVEVGSGELVVSGSVGIAIAAAPPTTTTTRPRRSRSCATPTPPCTWPRSGGGTASRCSTSTCGSGR